MTPPALTSAMLAPAAFALAGLIFGLGYFAALRRAVGVCGASPRRVMPAVLALGRIVAAVGFFGLAARVGAVSLLTAFLGFLIARTLALRAARRRA